MMDILYNIFYELHGNRAVAGSAYFADIASEIIRESHASFMGHSVFAGSLSGGNEQPGVSV